MPWTVFFVTCVSSCLFLSPNPIIMFLQLCDMSGAVLDTCEGDFRVSWPQLTSLYPPSQPSQLPGHHPSHQPLPSLHVAQTHQKHAYFTYCLSQSQGGPPGLGAYGFLRSLACFSLLLIRSWEPHPAEGAQPFFLPMSP